MAELLDHDLVATQDSLREYKRQANAAEAQTGIARAAYQDGSRAVIAAGGLTWDEPPARDKDGYLSIYLTNIGKDAVSVDVASDSYVSADLHDVRDGGFNASRNGFCDRVSGTRPGHVLSPSQSQAFTSTLKVPSERVNQVLDDTGTLIVQGCAAYRDFEVEHRTSFCYVGAQRGFTASLQRSPLCDDAGRYD